MKIFILTLLFLIGFQRLQAQNDSLKANTIKACDDYNKGVTYSFQLGIWKSLGLLDTSLNTNPDFGFKWQFPISKTLKLEFGANFNIPINAKSFKYYLGDSIFTVKSKGGVNGLMGFWIAHENRIKTSIIFDKYFGIGFGFISTNKKKKQVRSRYEDYWYSVNTFNFNFGLGLRKIVSAKGSLGCFIEYNYAPYSWFGRVKSDFENSYLITGVSYRF